MGRSLPSRYPSDNLSPHRQTRPHIRFHRLHFVRQLMQKKRTMSTPVDCEKGCRQNQSTTIYSGIRQQQPKQKAQYQRILFSMSM